MIIMAAVTCVFASLYTCMRAWGGGVFASLHKFFLSVPVQADLSCLAVWFVVDVESA